MLTGLYQHGCGGAIWVPCGPVRGMDFLWSRRLEYWSRGTTVSGDGSAGSYIGDVNCSIKVISGRRSRRGRGIAHQLRVFLLQHMWFSLGASAQGLCRLALSELSSTLLLCDSTLACLDLCAHVHKRERLWLRTRGLRWREVV